MLKCRYHIWVQKSSSEFDYRRSTVSSISKCTNYNFHDVQHSQGRYYNEQKPDTFYNLITSVNFHFNRFYKGPTIRYLSLSYNYIQITTSITSSSNQFHCLTSTQVVIAAQRGWWPRGECRTTCLYGTSLFTTDDVDSHWDFHVQQLIASNG